MPPSGCSLGEAEYHPSVLAEGVSKVYLGLAELDSVVRVFFLSEPQFILGPF